MKQGVFKQANTVATIILIAVLLVGSFVLVQQQVFPSQSSFIERTINTFSQFVFDDPKDVVKEYAMSGYQLDGYWYCGDYASPPMFDQVVDEFPLFAQDLLAGRLETIKQEFPDFDIEISKPNFAFSSVDGDILVDTRVGVNVSNFTVTVRDGERIIGLSYDEQYEYALRFWRNYQVMFDWISTGNGGVFSTVDEVLESRACAFVKDQCFCATDDPEAYTDCDDVGLGERCNPCPCYEHNPVYTEENCESGDPLACQDFVPSEREEIIQEFGINRNDLIVIGDRISEQLEAQFVDDVSCRAQVSEPFVQNSFVSAFILHPSACPREQVGGTCGIVPINVFDTIMCAARTSGDCHICPTVADVSNEIGESAFNNNQMLNECLSVVDIDQDTCELIDIENTDTGEITQEFACQNAQGSWIVIGGNETSFVSCSPENNLPAASRGASGQNSLASPSLFPNQCNPLPDDASPRATDRAQEMFERGQFSATSTVKKLEDIPTYSDLNSVWWEGTNGWLDRRGAMDLTITCSDPGTDTLEAFETQIDLRLVFRHGCDTSQNRVQVVTMAVCGAASDSNIPSCNCPDDGNPCTSNECVFDEETEEYECVRNNLDDVYVIDPSNSCQRLMCEDGVINPENTNPVEFGATCTTGSAAYCNHCDGAGACVPKEDGTQCFGNAGVCETSSCEAGACVPKISLTASCNGGSCGECECTEDGPSYSMTPAACEQLDPLSQWTSCTTQEEFPYTCVGTSSGRYDCELSGSSSFDTSVCCPGPGAGSQICTGGTICCGEEACTSPDSCDAQ